MTTFELTQMIDIRDPSAVEVLVSANGRTLHINVDGICRLRVQHFDSLEINDYRPKEENTNVS